MRQHHEDRLGSVSCVMKGPIGRRRWFWGQEKREGDIMCRSAQGSVVLCAEGDRVVVGVSRPWEWEVEGAGLGHRDGIVRWCPAWEVCMHVCVCVCWSPVLRKGIWVVSFRKEVFCAGQCPVG
jgi:hypothetical protein